MYYFWVILGAYVIGSSSMSFYLSKLKGVDIRKKGSGNLGASNAMLVMGWPSAVLVGLHDIGKSVLAVRLAKFLFPTLRYIGVIAGVASILGHIFPFYLGFKGGKGFASYLGMILSLDWKLGLNIVIVMIAVVLISDYLLFGVMTTIAVSPICFGIIKRSLPFSWIMLIASGVMLYKHQQNFIRLANGGEIGIRAALRGEHKSKI